MIFKIGFNEARKLGYYAFLARKEHKHKSSYLHKDLTLHPETRYNGEYTGYFDTEEELLECIEKFIDTYPEKCI